MARCAHSLTPMLTEAITDDTQDADTPELSPDVDSLSDYAQFHPVLIRRHTPYTHNPPQHSPAPSDPPPPLDSATRLTA